ncbi:MAG: RNA ligase family protein [Candidatus Aenigmatarchaeota archaeon]|nr:RNA ligase family protein [Candidatus Aenigmarchaeota archaeon]
MKFPRTPHVYAEYSGLEPDDLRYSSEESDNILKGKYVVLTEKLDGSNVSISFSPGLEITHRGNHTEGYEFSLLKSWCAANMDKLRQELNEKTIFGEWLYLRHTIPYKYLPHYLILFDVFDHNRGFLSYEQVVKIASNLNLPHAPILYEGIFPGFEFLKNLLERKSEFGDEKIEGVYGRVQENGLTVFRFKFVNPEFIQKVDQSDHWKRKRPEIQGLRTILDDLFNVE